jgi:PAS domain-containing protein
VSFFHPPDIAAAPSSARSLERVYAAAAVLLVAGICGLLPRIIPEGELSVNAFAAIVIAVVACLGMIAFLFYLRRRPKALAAQRSLDEARAATLSILGVMDEAVLLADIRQEGGPLIYVNRAFERITGYSASEAIGKNCRYLQGNDRLRARSFASCFSKRVATARLRSLRDSPFKASPWRNSLASVRRKKRAGGSHPGCLSPHCNPIERNFFAIQSADNCPRSREGDPTIGGPDARKRLTSRYKNASALWPVKTRPTPRPACASGLACTKLNTYALQPLIHSFECRFGEDRGLRVSWVS